MLSWPTAILMQILDDEHGNFGGEALYGLSLTAIDAVCLATVPRPLRYIAASPNVAFISCPRGRVQNLAFEMIFFELKRLNK